MTWSRKPAMHGFHLRLSLLEIVAEPQAPDLDTAIFKKL